MPKGALWKKVYAGIFTQHSTPLAETIRPGLLDYSDAPGIGIFLPCLVMHIHPARAETLYLYHPAVYQHFIGVERRERHAGRCGIGPPVLQHFFNCLDHNLAPISLLLKHLSSFKVVIFISLFDAPFAFF